MPRIAAPLLMAPWVLVATLAVSEAGARQRSEPVRTGTTTTSAARLAAQGRLLEARENLTSKRDGARTKAREIEALTRRIPKLSLKPAAGFVGDVIVDARALAKGELNADLELDPGSHEIVVRGADGKIATKQVVTLAERERHVIVLEAPPVPEKREAPAKEPPPASAPVTRNIAFVGLGVAALSASAGAVFLGLSASERSSLQERCPNDRCSEADRAAFDRGRGQAEAATIAFAAGAILATASVALLVFGKPSQERGVEIRATSQQILAAGRF